MLITHNHYCVHGKANRSHKCHLDIHGFKEGEILSLTLPELELTHPWPPTCFTLTPGHKIVICKYSFLLLSLNYPVRAVHVFSSISYLNCHWSLQTLFYSWCNVKFLRPFGEKRRRHHENELWNLWMWKFWGWGKSSGGLLAPGCSV